MVGRARPNQHIQRGFLFSKKDHNEIVPDHCSDFEDQHRVVGKQYSEVQVEDQDKLLISDNRMFAKTLL